MSKKSIKEQYQESDLKKAIDDFCNSEPFQNFQAVQLESFAQGYKLGAESMAESVFRMINEAKKGDKK